MSTVETSAARTAAPVLVLPHLYHPFESPIHPDANLADRNLLEWLDGHGLLSDERWANGIRHGKVGEYCARVYAHATSDGLIMTSRAYAWIFAIDDGLCSLHGAARSPGDLSALYIWLYETISDPYGYDPSPVRHALGARLPELAAFLIALQNTTVDICRYIRALVTPGQYARWSAGMMSFMFSTLWEIGRFGTGITPGLAEYISGRKYTGCGEAAYAFIDMASSFEVPDHLYNDDEIQRLRKLTSVILCLCNDIFSFPKEVNEACGNVVVVLMHERGLAAQAALEAAVTVHNEYMDRYLTLDAKLRARIDSPAATRLLDQTRTYIRGNYNWHFESPRYDAVRHYNLSRALRPGAMSAAAER